MKHGLRDAYTYNKVRPIGVHLCIRTRTDVFARAHVAHESWERTSMHHLTRRGVSDYHLNARSQRDGISGRDLDRAGIEKLIARLMRRGRRDFFFFHERRGGRIGLMLECQAYASRLSRLDARLSNRDFT